MDQNRKTKVIGLRDTGLCIHVPLIGFPILDNTLPLRLLQSKIDWHGVIWGRGEAYYNMVILYIDLYIVFFLALRKKLQNFNFSS